MHNSGYAGGTQQLAFSFHLGERMPNMSWQYAPACLLILCKGGAGNTCRTQGELPGIEELAFLSYVEEGRGTHAEHKVS